MNIPSYFEEDAYLFYNPDVAAAVAAGAFISGYQHWLQEGWKEYRAGAPREYVANRAVFAPRCSKRTFGVNLYGFLSTPSGLGEAARSCETAIKKAAIALRTTDVPLWTSPEAVRIAPPEEERYRINLIQQNPDMMPLFVRAFGESVLHGAYNIGFWFWELPSARSDWFQYYEFVDEIWVASEFCRRSFSCLTKLPVVTMPLVIEGLETKLSYGRDHFGLPSSAFVFGYIYDVNSYIERKNPLALIEAFRHEFGNSRDVLLVLKQSHGGGPRNPNAAVVERAVGGARNIRIIDAEFSQEEIISFQNAIDCFASPHRAEGFGFNLAQSMYLGKPVIATGYSGNVDFMDEGNSYVLDSQLVTIGQTIGPYVKGSVWAEPSVDHLRVLLRRVFENSGERLTKGTMAAETIRGRFSSYESGRRMDARFHELGLDQPKVTGALFSRHSTRALARFIHSDTPPAVMEEIRKMDRKPLIRVILAVRDAAPEVLRQCVDSVRTQWYPYWELWVDSNAVTSPELQAILNDCRGLEPRIKITSAACIPRNYTGPDEVIQFSAGEYVIFYSLREIPPHFLLEAAVQLQTHR